MKTILGGAALALAITISGFGAQTAVAESTKAETKAGVWGDIVYGNPMADNEIIEYGSLTCSHCAHFSNDILPIIKEKLLDTGKAKLVFRNIIRDQVDLSISAVARCSDMETAQKLQEAIFADQHNWLHAGSELAMVNSVADIAAKLGMDRATFDRCMADTDMRKKLVEITQTGARLYGVNATPTIIVNGRVLENYAAETIEAAVSPSGN